VDFIENAQLRGRLHDADERKNQFLAVLAHELRNPLAPIRNALELLRVEGQDRAKSDRTLAMLERQVLQMVRLIDDLMDVSRLTRGLLTLKKERVSLTSVLETAIESTRPALESAGHQFNFMVPVEPILLEADPTRLAQVFSNLLGNAAKFTPRGGHIALEVERKGSNRAVVTVRDDGRGIPPGSIANIFDMFAQLGDPLDRAQAGLGVGLSIARRLVELHGGTVTARSDGLGHGSEFNVELPVMIDSRSTSQDGAPPTAEAKSSTGRVLVVDDNEDAATSLALLVGRLGHKTRVAHDGIEAVRLAAEFRPEVIFLDIGLPKLSGYDVAKAIRSQWWGRTISLVALTGWGQEKDQRLSAESGVDLHVVKPINPASVGELIQRCLRKSKQPT
jgi:CheY-like chemotaxis protein